MCHRFSIDFDRCSIDFRLAFDRFAIAVRYLFDMCSIDSMFDRFSSIEGGLEEDWRTGEGLEEDWRRIGGGLEDWRRIGGGSEKVWRRMCRQSLNVRLNFDRASIKLFK